jgi:5-formyltetrahydrofolate cyclo-ligase
VRPSEKRRALPGSDAEADRVRHKYFLRNFFKRAAKSIPADHRGRDARRLAARFSRLPAFRRAKTVGLYLALPHEIDTAPVIRLCRRAGKGIAVPVLTDIRQGTMRFGILSLNARLKRNGFGIPEPVDLREAVPDVLLVPGRAFTPQGIRLGSGGGSYDRYLADHPSVFTIGLAYDEQICARLPASRHDRRVRMVLTPTRLFKR